MDATSSYRAATFIEQPSISSVADIYANATSIQTSSQGFSDESMESTGSSLGGGIGNRVNNIYIISRDGINPVVTITRKNIFENFDIGTHNNWSGSIPIQSLVYNSGTDIIFDEETALNVGVGASGSNAQTIARIPIIRDKKMLNSLGVYREGLAAKDGDIIVEYYKI